MKVIFRFPITLLFLWFLGMALVSVVEAQSRTEKLSEIDWDAEESSESVENTPLSDIDWEDGEKEKQEPDFSTMNWEEEENPVKPASGTGGLDSIDWDAGEENSDEGGLGWEEEDLFENLEESYDPANELMMHMQGGSLFLIYLLGCVFTPFFMRKSPLFQQVLPEFQMILYTFWPFAWLLLAVLHLRSQNK